MRKRNNPAGTRKKSNPLVERLRREVRARPGEVEPLYHLALAELDRGTRALPAGTLRRVCGYLEQAIRLQPKMPEAHALFAYAAFELGDTKAALAAIRPAVRLEPGNETCQEFFLELLDCEGRHRELGRKMAEAAKRRGMDLAALRKELLQAGFRADPSTVRLNAFPAGTSHFQSEIVDAIEELRRRCLGGAESEEAEAVAARRRVRLDARKIPSALRRAIPLARHWGIPDDVARGYLVRRISAAERMAMRKGLPVNLRRAINAWLDSFAASKEMSFEAARFMYLLEAYDEIFPVRS